MVKRSILIILDGWGIGKVPESDAITHAHTPFVNSLYKNYPNSTLITCGNAVGLPEGQMGNSEVGHLNLGAGRIVYQDLEKININIKEDKFKTNPGLQQALQHVRINNSTLNLIGLVSDGGVHSHIDHLKEILTICASEKINKVVVHAFTDGRDTDPKSGFHFIEDLLMHMDQTTGKIGSLIGRYYAMDRDKRWERIKKAYDAITQGKGTGSDNMLKSITESYKKGITDEFIEPVINRGVYSGLKEGDAIICFNFRTDRCREITEVLTQRDIPENNMRTVDVAYFTMTEYDHKYKNIIPFFKKDDLKNTLGEVLSREHRTQLRIAETEKYPHVSFFFSGGREVPFEGEKRVMVQSPKVATYDLKPEMSAYDLTDTVIAELENDFDFICLNYANADMVGHTGVWDAVVKAVETVDSCLEKVVKILIQKNYSIFITADHGNADYEKNSNGTPNTAHTTNLVPYFIIDNEIKDAVNPGILADVAPTILDLMKIPVPEEMTGKKLY